MSGPAVERRDVETHGVDSRVVIVTGAGQGIGRGVALHLGKHGASIVVAEWKQHRAERTVAELTDLGVPALAVVCDIMHREQIDAMVAQTLDHFGKVDALVNNAQTFRPQAPLATVSEEFRAALAGSIPFPSRLATAEEFAALVVSIVEHDYLNGETVRFDGALRMASR